MKRFLFIFGAIYIFFFAVPFPMLMYYSTKDDFDINYLKDKSPWLALVIVAVSIVMWLLVFTGYFRTLVLRSFISKRNIEQLKTDGVHRTAKILTATKLSKPGAKYDTYELSLSLKNLVDTEIVQKGGVNDTKPLERRFEPGKTVDLMIDKDIKRIPYFIFASSEAVINKTVVALKTLGWLALFALVIGYYIYAYQTESYGMGWRFIGFGHPLIICPAVFLFYRLIIKLLLRKIGTKPNDAALIKFKGIKTTAKLVSASQTGTFINEQPMILFQLEYTDEKQQKHTGSLKKVVNLLDLDSTKQENVAIFYLKEDPKRIAFASDLNEIS